MKHFHYALSLWLFIALCFLAGKAGLAQGTQANITVDANTSMGVVPSSSLGVNTAAWDENLLNPGIPNLLKQAGAVMLRYPGGSTADQFHWEDNSTTPFDAGVTKANTFDAFMSVAHNSGASVIITVNYGSNAQGTGGGDPAEAARWVHHANVETNSGVKYWEIGNEIYGNGYYGAQWETDLHTDKSPDAYATNALEYIRQMKQIDASIKVGVVLTAPRNWPDGQHDSTHQEWNPTVLSRCGSKIDFVAVHWYPQQAGSENDGNLLTSVSNIAGMTAQLRTLINQYCGANAPNVQILITETNSVNTNPGKQTLSIVNALFLADNITTWLENGVTSVQWWDLHNGATHGNTNSNLFGNASYGTYGLLSGGDANTGEPQVDTPYASYYGMKMLHRFAQPGDRMIAASSDQNMVGAHAVRQANGNLSLLLINKNQNSSVNAAVSLNGFMPNGSAQTFFYGKDSNDLAIGSAAVSRNFTVSLMPYSLTVLNLTAAPVSSAPAFTSSATAAPATLAPGQTLTIHATPVDTGGALTNGVVDVEVFDASYNRVAQQFYTQQNFASGQSRDYAWTLAAPSDMGTYTVKVGVFSQDWSSLIHWNDKAATFTVFLNDPAQYNFETGTQGWVSTGGAIVGVASSTTRAFLGAQSLAVNFSSSHSDTQQVYIPLPSVVAGKTVTFHVWIPGGSAVYAVQPYVLQGAAGNWQWTGNFQYTSGMKLNAWNTLQVTIPANVATPLDQLGIQFFTGSGWSGTCYIDSVSW